MTHHVHGETPTRDFRKLGMYAVALFIAAYLLIGGHSNSQSHVVSAEAAYSDISPSGLELVPASGGTVTGSYESSYEAYYQAYYQGYYQGAYEPAYTGSYEPAYTGSYQGAYTGSYEGGYTGSYEGAYTGSYTGSYEGGYTSSYGPVTGSYVPTTCWDGSTVPAGQACPPCPEGYTQVGNACVPPQGPVFEGFPTPYGFNASGHLEVRPSLVRSGDTTRVFWSVRNVRNCTVRGTNGDGAVGSVTGAWNTQSSGAVGLVTSPITSRTDYTLFCRSLAGATPTTITETRTVNVIPEWYEPSEGN